MVTNLKILYAFLFLLSFTSLSSNVLGQYDTTAYEITFEAYDNPMWKVEGFSFDYRKKLFHESWNQSYEKDYIESIMGSEFGMGFSAKAAGHLGMEFFFEGLTTGTIDKVTYPVKIELITPQSGSFNAGQKITINSNFIVQDGAKIETTYPNSGKVGLDFDFAMDNDLSFEACMFDCVTTPDPIPDFSLDMTLFQLSTVPGETFYPGFTNNGIPPFACYDPPSVIPDIIYNDFLPVEFVSSPSEEDSVHSFSPSFSGSIDLPYVNNVSTNLETDSRISAYGEDSYINLGFDVISTLLSYTGHQINGELTAPGIGCFAALKYDIFHTDIGFDITNVQDFSFDAKLSVKLELPVAVEYKIVRDPDMVIETGTDSIIIYRVGDRLEFIFPCEYDYIDFKPSFELINSFTNHTYNRYDLSLTLSALEFELEFKKVVIVPEVSFEVCFPFVGCEEITTPEVAFDPPDYSLGPAWDETYNIGTFNTTLFEETWELDGFKTIPTPTFRIDPQPFNIDLAPNEIFCDGDSTGSIILSESGATYPLTYEWSTGATARNLENVAAGDYYVKVTDKNGCVAYQGTRVHEPDSISVNVLSENCICHGDATGSIHTEVSGGIPPYNYQWSNGANTTNLENITAGTYTLTITDQNGCIEEDTIVITEPPELTSYINNHGTPSCNGFKDGFAKLNVSGGTEPYRYQWSNFRVTKNVDSLEAGDYSVTVSDYNGCISSSSVTIPQPPPLEGELYVEKPISCYNGSDGIIAIDLTGGSPPYHIDWYSPEHTINQRKSRITELYEGLYQIEVLDSNDCYLKDTLFLDSPDEPLYSDIETRNPGCSYSADGAATLSVYNGTKPYSYQWSTGATSKNISGLSDGEYDVTITDDLGCETFNNAVLVAPDELKAYTEIKKVSCLEETDGEIKLIPYGGIAPYEVSWSTGASGQTFKNLAPGFYDATIQDDQNCIKTVTIEMLVNGKGCLDIPNAYTPNGDGINDKWVIRHLDLYPEHSIKVFTKWGSLIYEAKGDADKRPWDGTYKGKKMPSATYYYIIDLGNGEPLKKGLVTIVR